MTTIVIYSKRLEYVSENERTELGANGSRTNYLVNSAKVQRAANVRITNYVLRVVWPMRTEIHHAKRHSVCH